MRIDSSTIGMESDRRYTQIQGRVSRFTITGRRQGLMDGTGGLFGNLVKSDAEGETAEKEEKEAPQGDLKTRLEEIRAKLNGFSSGGVQKMSLRETQSQLYNIRSQCINYLLTILFPGDSFLNRFEAQAQSGSYQEGNSNSGSNTGTQAQQAGTDDALLSFPGAGVRTFQFSRQYYYEETENTTFQTTGTVKCGDGREINFNLNMEMSRSFQEYYEENITMIQTSMCDPLVINLEGNIADLSDQTFYFDIDGDGEKDEINRLAQGSGYLALDKNGDGSINDGTELFGTKSGNGFADLASYDLDGNGFIDEGDEIFDKLKIWCMDENGKEQLYTLKEKGVGAICLSNRPTDFSITGNNGETKGAVRNSGFFLYENGNAGSVQHVDLALHGKGYSQVV